MVDSPPSARSTPNAPPPPSRPPTPNAAPETTAPTAPPTAPTAPGEPGEPKGGKRGWLAPAGVSAIATLLACVISVVAIVIDRGDRQAPAAATDTSAAPPGQGLAMNKWFVYGSTQPGQPRFEAISTFVVDQQPDSVKGYLYDSGQDYPAAKFGAAGPPIPGWVLTIDPGEVSQFDAVMTRMEGGLFAPVEVRTESGLRVRAFEWIGEPTGMERIDRWPR